MLDVFCGGSQKSSELWQTGNKTYDVYAIQDEAVWATITVRLDGEVRSGQNPRNPLAVSVLPDCPTAVRGCGHVRSARIAPGAVGKVRAAPPDSGRTAPSALRSVRALSGGTAVSLCTYVCRTF